MRFKYFIILVIAAAIMWIEMFVLKHFNFWIEMTIAGSLLAGISFYINHKAGSSINARLYDFKSLYIAIGLISAAILYLIFFAGDRISNLLFNFAEKQVNGIYGNKTLLDPVTIGLLLFFIIGPAEEIFWRGFVQDTLMEKLGENKGWLIASLIYGGVHIFAMNFMLFMAALICGLFWGYIFKKYKSLWPGIISHAVWDLTIFLIIPVR
ncbi:MAG: CPBP family intramembrane metalloprotease [Ignavibacteriae bacterium]|nr:MAG: CPBP family intramembrane metalloprotease [Ignavibacteriota bacterium]